MACTCRLLQGMVDNRLILLYVSGMNHRDPATAKAVEIAGGYRALAGKVGVSQQTVSNWMRFGISRAKIADVVNATRGQVTWQECLGDVLSRIDPEYRT